MKKGIAMLLAVLMLALTGCVEQAPQTEGVQTETVQTESGPEPTVAVVPELPEQVVTPEEMPQAPEADATIPPQPQSTIITE